MTAVRSRLLQRPPLPAPAGPLGAAGAGGGPAVAELDDLAVSFSRNDRVVSAVRGVSLAIGRAEIVGLVGESGSGKSVLGLSLLGLLPSQPRPQVSGTARVCGVDMVHASTDEQRRVRRDHLGAVFQDPMTSLNPTMRVGRQVAEAAGSAEEAVRLLEAVGVPDAKGRARAFPHQLSGGLRQRVMTAMAIAGRPSFVIADEPTTALDVTVQAQILDLLGRLRDELSTSFLLVTHDLGVAAQIADRIVVMYAGRVVEAGPAAEVFRNPRHPYTAGLLRSRLRLDAPRSGPLVTLPGEPPDPRAHPPGCAFAPRCPHATTECTLAPPVLLPVGPGSGDSSSSGGGNSDGGNSDGPSHVAACIHLSARSAGGAEDPAAVGGWPVPAPSAAGRPPAVLVNGLSKSFTAGSLRHRRRLQALRGVDLEVREGEAVALVGESGCGKSTLLRAIAGLQPAEVGSIELGRGGRPQMVFQDAGASLTPWLTVGELVGERLREEGLGRRERSRRVGEALAMVGLPSEVAAAKPAQLSGGQRQRVALARAVVVPPEVLLCDEPTSALDVSLAATVLNLVGRLRRELGMAVLFVTHDLAAARVVADRIAVMYLGRIVETGPAEELCARPLHPYTAALLSAVPGLGRPPVRLEGEPANPLEPPGGCAFHPRCPRAEASCTTGDQVLAGIGPREPFARLLACGPVAKGLATSGSGPR